MSSQDVWRLFVAACKIVVVLSYGGLLALLFTRLDAAANMKSVRLIRFVFAMFFGLSIVTYLHIGYYIYKGYVPDDYWNQTWYLIFVFLHALFGVIAVILSAKLTAPRVVNDEIYSQFIERQYQAELKEVLSHNEKEEVLAIKKMASDTTDLASLLLKAYK